MTKSKSNHRKMGAPERSNRTSLIARGKPWSIEMDEWLHDEAKARGCTVADIVREGLDWYRTAKESAKEDVVKNKI